MVNVEVPLTLSEAGLKFAVAFVGNPLKLKFTLPLKLPFVEIVNVKVLVLPAMTVCETGDTVMENGPVTGMVDSRLNCWFAPPL